MSRIDIGSCVLGVLLSLLFTGPGRTTARAAEPSRPVRVVYFVPTDRTPEPDRVERLDRVMTEVQRFLREGLESQGHGARTLPLERDKRGRLQLHLVQARGPQRNYGRNSAGLVRREVKEALARQGLDIDRETIIIFQLLLDWRGAEAVEIGPYVGSGDTRNGTAWVYDDPKLDPRLLASREPGGYYHGPCSLGQFNTHYLGGVIHELGHALGLPHERERDGEQATRGHSLMGSGNHTYGQELRGEGRGTFLTAAAALPLAYHPLFTGRPPAATPARIDLTELAATAAPGQLTLTGQLSGSLPLVGLVAYWDPLDRPGDYDAVGWTCPVDADGRFELTLRDLRRGDHELRLRAIGESGESRYFAFPVTVGEDGRPGVSALSVSPLVTEALAAFRARQSEPLARLLAQGEQQTRRNETALRQIRHLQRLLDPPAVSPLDQIPDQRQRLPVSQVAFRSSAVGWGHPQRDQVPVEGDAGPWLRVGGQVYESGLYAHAPARYELPVERRWKTLRSQYGLQDGHAGSVVFVVRGDDRELFRSPLVRDTRPRTLEIDIAEVNSLELIVEDGGDDRHRDWGVWLEPELRR